MADLVGGFWFVVIGLPDIDPVGANLLASYLDARCLNHSFANKLAPTGRAARATPSQQNHPTRVPAKRTLL